MRDHLTHVLDGKGDGLRDTRQRRRRYRHAGHGQIGRRLRIDEQRARSQPCVVRGASTLIGGTVGVGHDQHVIGTRHAARQVERGAGGIAGPHGHIRVARHFAQQDAAGGDAVCLRQIDLVREPGRGRAIPQITDAPGHGNSVASMGCAGCRHRLGHEVRIGRCHGDKGRRANVLAAPARLAYRTRHVRFDKDGPSSVIASRQHERPGGGVGRPHGERPAMHDLADHDVVRITRRIVPAEHDRVGPARDIRRLCARVRNGPGHRDRAAAAGRGRGGYANDDEVRMGPRGAGNGNVLRIVAVRVLRRIFLRYHGAVIVISVGNDGHHQGTGCGRRVGQQQAHATRQCCTGCQPCGWRIGRHYQAGERCPGLNVVDRYAVAPAANRCERAAVDVRPSERELPTRLGRRCGIDGQVGHDQIRRGQHVQLRPVFYPGRFDHLV